MKYSKRRQSLRVTSPAGSQRSTYYLQLPYQYSIPLLALSSLLSWLASQSFFFIQIRLVDEGGYLDSVDGDFISTCAYSRSAIVLTMIVGTLITVGSFILGMQRYHPDMPLAATNSAAISAACHPLPGDDDAAVLPVQWGVVSIDNGVGHCAFSSRTVAPMIPGYMYKGKD